PALGTACACCHHRSQASTKRVTRTTSSSPLLPAALTGSCGSTATKCWSALGRLHFRPQLSRLVQRRRSVYASRTCGITLTPCAPMVCSDSFDGRHCSGCADSRQVHCTSRPAASELTFTAVTFPAA